MQVNFKGELLTIKKELYANNRRTCLRAIDSNHEVFATLTINLPDVPLEENEIILKNYSENKDLSEVLLNLPEFELTGKMVQSGYVICPIVKINL